MRRLILLIIVLSAISAVFADDNQAFLGIFAETSVMKMIGMPDMSAMMQKMTPEMQAKMGAMMPGMPHRALTVRLWSPGIAPDNATASLAIPDGLKLGKTLDLGIYRPEAAKGGASGSGGANDMSDIPDFTIKYYWGSSPTVKEGQPKVVDVKSMLTPAMIARMRTMMKKGAARGGEYYYKPDWTTGYWPAARTPGNIGADAALAGSYALTTSYTGAVSLDVPDNVNFLAPLEMTAPKLDTLPPLDQAIAFNWKPVPNILGYHMQIMGMIGKNTLIIWDSAEARQQAGIDWDYMQMSQVRDLVKQNMLMGPERTDATVPAGIFVDCDFVSMMMIGYGPGTALAEGQPLPRVQTKTTLTMMLGGKKMPAMGGRGRPQQPMNGTDE
jgi:hypothetical protein